MKIVQRISIQANSDDVFNFISNFENNPKWQKGMIACSIVDNAPLGLGQKYNQEASFLGKEIISVFEVIDYKPGEMVKATTLESSFPITFTRMVEQTPSACMVTAIVEGDSSGFFKIIEPIMKWMVKNSIAKDYKKLKQLMEDKSV